MEPKDSSCKSMKFEPDFSEAIIGQFTVVCLVSQPLSEREAEVDLVLIKNLDPFLM